MLHQPGLKMLQFNLLPWREQARKANRTRFITAAIGFFIIALLIVITLHFFYSSRLNHQQNINQFIQAEIDNEQAFINDLNKQKGEKTSIENKMRLLMNLYHENFQLIRFFNELTPLVPNSIMIMKITHTPNTIVLNGKADSDADVTNFMQMLSKNPVINQPELSSIDSQKDLEDNATVKKFFELTMKLKE
jgi:type IV pilus assembly protein PilN